LDSLPLNFRASHHSEADAKAAGNRAAMNEKHP
jgi:hypothetical protein